MIEGKNNRGITLIVLIITVIIFIILLGVSIDIAVSHDFFGISRNTVGKTNAQMENKSEQEESIKNAWAELPGKTIKSQGSKNNAPTLTTSVSNVTATTATITAIGTDKDGDTLQYTLKIDGETYGPSTTNKWDLTGLKENVTYDYTVEVTDEKATIRATGSFTTVEGNNSPTLTVGISDVTTASAIITATGSDEDGDTLQYTLILNGTTISGPEESSVWALTDLNDYTEYSYTVKVTDGLATVTKSGAFRTLCGGPGLCYDSVLCTCCPYCGGEGVLINSSSTSWIKYDNSINGCYICGEGYVNGLDHGPVWTEDSSCAAGYCSGCGMGSVRKHWHSGKICVDVNHDAGCPYYSNVSVTSTPCSYCLNGYHESIIGGEVLAGDGSSGDLLYDGEILSTKHYYCSTHNIATEYPYHVSLDSNDKEHTTATYCRGDYTTSEVDCTACADGSCTGINSGYGYIDSYDNDDSGETCEMCTGLEAEYYASVECTECGEYYDMYLCSMCLNAIESGSSLSGMWTNFKESSSCTYCEGDGLVSQTNYTGYCSTHECSAPHYYCTTHSYVGTEASHYYCEHGYSTEHN